MLFLGILTLEWPNDLEGQCQRPPFSIPATVSIPLCMFGANLVIPVQIGEESSCRLGKVYGQTNGLMDWQTDGQMQEATTIFLRSERARIKQGKSEGFESCDWPIVPKRPIWVKIGDVLYRVTLQFDGWPWKTIGHLSFAVSSFVQHFIAIGEFKLELQSGNAHFGSNSTIFRAVWPWNLTDDLEKQYSTSTMLLLALCIIS